MPFKDPEKRREYGRVNTAKRRAENPSIKEAEREYDRVRWQNMTPEQRKRKEAQRSDASKAARNAYMKEYLSVPENRARVNARRMEVRSARIASGDTSVREMHNAATDKYHKKYRGDIKYQARKVLATAKNRSKRLGITSDLTIEWYLEEHKKGCAATGIPFNDFLEGSPWVAHIDKMIPAKGYVISNCRLVCACFNMAKREWTDADVLKMAQAFIGKQSVSDA